MKCGSEIRAVATTVLRTLDDISISFYLQIFYVNVEIDDIFDRFGITWYMNRFNISLKTLFYKLDNSSPLTVLHIDTLP